MYHPPVGRPVILGAALFLACDDPSTPPEVPASTTSTPQPSGDTGTSTGSATEPDTAALELALQAAIDALPMLTMVPCYAAWAEVSQDQDGSCPIYFGAETSAPSWYASCLTEGGTQYAGIFTTRFEQASYVEQELRGPVMDRFGPEVVPGYAAGRPYQGPDLDGVGMDGAAIVVLPGSLDPDFVFGGDGASTTVTHEGLTLRHHWIDALCEVSGGEDGTWMAAGLVPSIHIDQLAAEGDDVSLTNVSGAFTGLSGAYPTVEFVDVTLRPTGLRGATASPCDLEPVGSIWLTNREKGPVVVVFEPREACDGCGELRTGWGEPLGEVCADFSAMKGSMGPTDIGRVLP